MTSINVEYETEKRVIARYKQLIEALRAISKTIDIMKKHYRKTDIENILRIERELKEEKEVYEGMYPDLDFIFQTFREEKLI